MLLGETRVEESTEATELQVLAVYEACTFES